MTNLRNAFCFSLLLLAAAPLALAQITYTEIDYPGSVGTGVTGINSAGEMVGEYQLTFAGANHGFTLSQGQFTSFDYPGGGYTYPNGINDHGQIVGNTCTTECGFPYGFAFVYDGQTFTKISYPNQIGTEGNAINNAGEIVGRIDGNKERPFLYVDGQFTLITLGGNSPDIDALGINNTGEIVGFRFGYRNDRAWALRNEKFKYLPLGEGIPTGVNDNAAIVGSSYADGVETGFVWSKGKHISLSYPGAYSTVATGINNAGQVVGYYTTGLGTENHGFVTSPITEADFEAVGVVQ